MCKSMRLAARDQPLRFRFPSLFATIRNPQNLHEILSVQSHVYSGQWNLEPKNISNMLATESSDMIGSPVYFRFDCARKASVR